MCAGYSNVNVWLSTLLFYDLCSKLDVLLEWKQVSVSKTCAGGEADAQTTTPTKFKLDSKFGQSFYQRFSNLLGTMA